MTNTKPQALNNPKTQLPATELVRLLTAVCQPGYHGTATLTVSLQDGHVQHVRVATERMVRA